MESDSAVECWIGQATLPCTPKRQRFATARQVTMRHTTSPHTLGSMQVDIWIARRACNFHIYLVRSASPNGVCSRTLASANSPR